MATGVNFGTQQYFGFDPRSLPNCVLWIDAADSNTVTLSGSSVTALKDKSSNAYTFSNATGFTYNVTKFNTSYPSFYAATSTTNHLGSNTSFSLSQPATFFIVSQLVDTAAGGYMFDSTTAGNRMAFIAYATGKPVLFAGVELSNTVTTTFTSPGLHGGVFNGTSSLVYSNATQTISGNAGTQGATGLILGARYTVGQSWGGHICELLMYSRSITTAERQQVEGYLAWKWGLGSNLPTSQPFRYYPPAMRILQPSDVDDCMAWFDAYDNSSFTLTGSTLATVSDKSGAGTSVVSIGGTPLWSSNGLNSLPTFDTTNGHFRGALSTTSPITNYRQTTFIVTQLDSSPGNGYPCVSMYESATGSSLVFRNLDYSTTPAFRSVGFFDSATPVASITSTQFGNPFIWIETYDGTANGNSVTSRYDYNGAQLTASAVAATAPSTSPTHFGVGSDGFTVNYNLNTWTGKISEVIIYNRILTADQIQLIEGYLANKWNLRSVLSNAHPFKNVLPATPVFHPLLLSNSTLWLDGTDSTNNSMTFSGANITVWKDKSGNGKDFTASGTGATLNTNPQGLLFTTNLYTSTHNASITSDETMFLVFYSTNTGSPSFPIGSSGSGGREIGFRTTSSFGVVNNGVEWGAQQTATSNTLYFACSIISSSGYATAFSINGGAFSTSNLSTAFSGTRTTQLGREGPSSFQYIGTICETFAYSRVLSSNERVRVEGYLAWKWGLQNRLPTTHPFYKFRP